MRGMRNPAAVFPALRGNALTSAWRIRAISKHLIALTRPTFVS
jgi:hypothetical protein